MVESSKPDLFEETRQKFWETIRKAAARTKGLPSWTSAGIRVGHGFEGHTPEGCERCSLEEVGE